jgi:hypothetical protein
VTSQQDTLSAVVDTFLPSLPVQNGTAGPVAEFFRVGAADRGIALAVERALPELPAVLHDAVGALLRHLEEQSFAGGRTTGVTAVLGHGESGRPITVSAPTVVLAAGGIESPAVLLRSGIGSPAVGKNLRLHPAWIVTGVYPMITIMALAERTSAALIQETSC